MISPIPLRPLRSPIRAFLTQNPLFLPRQRIPFLNRSKTYKERLVKPFYLAICNFISLVRDFFHTQHRPSGVFFLSIATVCCLLARTMASRF